MNADVIRKKIGLQRTDSKFLVAFLSSLLDHKDAVPCVACGKKAPRSNLWSTFNFAAEARAVLGDIAFVRGLESTDDGESRKDIILKNGFCPTCVRRLDKRLPEHLRIKVPKAPRRAKPARKLEATIDEAVRYLNQHHVVFNEAKFRVLWERSVRINFV